MVQIKKKRTFEALITDTFQYICDVWKHFIPTMLRVNIFYILAACVMLYFLWSKGSDFYGIREDIEALYTFSMSYGDMWAKIPLNSLAGYEVISMVVLTMTLMITVVVFKLYTPIYMILHDRYERVPSYEEICTFYKNRVPRIVMFMIWTVVLFILVGIVSIVPVVLLAVSIVGIPFLLIYVVLLQLIYVMTIYVYFGDDSVSFFKSISIAWEKVKSGFLKNIGVCILVSLISSMVMSVPKWAINVADNVYLWDNVFSGIVSVFMCSIFYLLVSVLYDVAVGLICFSAEEDKKGVFCGGTPQK